MRRADQPLGQIRRLDEKEVAPDRRGVFLLERRVDRVRWPSSAKRPNPSAFIN
jgi:hypothetical protein